MAANSQSNTDSQPNTESDNAKAVSVSSNADAANAAGDKASDDKASDAGTVIVSAAPSGGSPDLLSSPLPIISDLLIRAGEAGGTRHISDRRLFLDSQGSVVEAGSTEARYLLVGLGGDLPQDIADELGLKA